MIIVVVDLSSNKQLSSAFSAAWNVGSELMKVIEVDWSFLLTVVTCVRFFMFKNCTYKSENNYACICVIGILLIRTFKFISLLPMYTSS